MGKDDVSYDKNCFNPLGFILKSSKDIKIEINFKEFSNFATGAKM
jgi:hypothetical protein